MGLTEQECVAKMVAPGTHRPGKYMDGVIQIWTTNVCNLSCYACTQCGNIRSKPRFISLEHFEQACESLRGYWGVVGVFGANACTHPQFEDICRVMRKLIPYNQRGLWSNNLNGHGEVCRSTFNPAHSNLNVHLDQRAYDEMKRDWPECNPVGLTQDSRHSPPWVAMKDVLKKPCTNAQHEIEDQGVCFFAPCEECNGTRQVYDESKAWELISDCDINRNWSALLGVFRGELRAWFCEIAGAQAMLHQDEPDYPDTGLDPTIEYVTGYTPGHDEGEPWWKLPMGHFAHQVRKHCHECGIPLRGHGELAQAFDGLEQVSQTHAAVYKPKRKGRRIELVTVREQLGKPLGNVVRYLQNSQE